MRKINLPNGFEVPIAFEREGYVLEPLHPKHNEMDYEAWNSSKEELRGIFGPGDDWPHEVASKQQNLGDLTKDYQEFLDKKTFRYSILNSERSACIGCFYIRPSSNDSYDCRVDFWFRNSAKHFESGFLEEIDNWLRSVWKFSRIAYPGRKISWEEYNSNQ